MESSPYVFFLLRSKPFGDTLTHLTLLVVNSIESSLIVQLRYSFSLFYLYLLMTNAHYLSIHQNSNHILTADRDLTQTHIAVDPWLALWCYHHWMLPCLYQLLEIKVTAEEFLIFLLYISMCVSSNPVEGRTKIGHPKDLILTLFDLIFRRIYMFSINLVFEVTLKSSGTDIVYGCQLLRCLYNYRLLYGIFHIACHINPRRPY